MLSHSTNVGFDIKEFKKKGGVFGKQGLKKCLFELSCPDLDKEINDHLRFRAHNLKFSEKFLLSFRMYETEDFTALKLIGELVGRSTYEINFFNKAGETIKTLKLKAFASPYPVMELSWDAINELAYWDVSLEA